MEFDEHNEHNGVAEQEADAVEIYSRSAVFWFFFLLGPMFGGVLLMLNLKEAGYRKAINSILIFIIAFDVLTEVLLRLFISLYKVDIAGYQARLMAYKPGDSLYDPKILVLMVLMFAVKLSGAFILTRYFFRKYFPDNDYYPKPILNALLISALIWIILQFVGLGGI